MLRFHQSTSAADAKSYYTKADYYLEDGQETVGRWGGKAAVLLGLRGTVDRAAFDRLCDNLHPVTGEQLTARQRDDRTVGNDLTFDPPKSVSVLWELTQDERIRDAFRLSVEETMRDIEADAKTRVRKGGEDANRFTGNLAWATFYHSTARPVEGEVDMNMHAHCFTFNCTWDPVEKQWKAVQFRDIRQDAPYWEAAFHARLAGRLAAMGFEIKRKGRYFELVGVPQSVIDKFSRRKEQIEEEARERGITDPEEKGELGAKTREKKARNLSMEQLRREWVARLTRNEFEALAEVYGRAQEREGAGWRQPGPDPREALGYAAAHCYERHSSVPARELLAEALRYGVGAVGVERVWRHLEEGGRFTADVDGRLFVASRDVLAEERRLVKLARDGRATLAPLNPAYVIRDKKLNDGQRSAVRHLLASTDFATMVIGDAGVGKTTLLKEAMRGAQEAGARVLAFAPSAAASRITMRSEGFPDAETVAQLLANKQLQAEAAGQVLLIDEAALMGTRETAEVLDLARRMGARVWLVGDDKQHKSVSRGSPFELLQTKAGVRPARVSEIVRQQGSYKKLVELARDKPGKGFEQLYEDGWVEEVPTSERYALLASDYLEAVRPYKVKGQLKEPTALVIAPTHAEGARVTAAIRSGLKAQGKLGEEREVLQLSNLYLTEAQRGDAASYQPGDVLQFVQNAPGFKRGQKVEVESGRVLPLAHAGRFQAYRSGTLRLAVGERVRVTQNGYTTDRKHRLDNGDILTVRGFTPAGDIIDHRGWVIARDYGHLAHGYVTTSVSAQSRTVHRVLIAMGAQSIPATSREQLYVSLSRGREWARLYTDDAEAMRRAVQKSDARVSAMEVAARRKAQRTLRERMRKHLAFLRRRELQELPYMQPTIDRVPEKLAERQRERGLDYER